MFPNLSVRENLTLFADGHSTALDLAVEAFPRRSAAA